METKKQIEIVTRLRDDVTGKVIGIQRSFHMMGNTAVMSLRGVSSMVLNVKTALAGLGVALGSASFISAAADIETYRVQLMALYGDTKKADNMLLKMREFARVSPLETQAVIEGFVRLEAAGVKSADTVVKKLGDVSLLFKRELPDVARAFVSLERDPLLNLGVVVDRVGNKVRIASGEVVREFEKNGRTIFEINNEIRDKLIEVWQERFPDALELAGTTFRAKMEVFKSELFELRADIADRFMPAIKEMLDGVTNFLSENHVKIVAFFHSIPEMVSVIADGVKEGLANFGVANFAFEITEAFAAAIQTVLEIWDFGLRTMGSMLEIAVKNLFVPLLNGVAIAFNNILIESAKMASEIAYTIPFGLGETLSSELESLIGVMEAENADLAKSSQLHFENLYKDFQSFVVSLVVDAKESFIEVSKSWEGVDFGLQNILNKLDAVQKKYEAVIIAKKAFDDTDTPVAKKENLTWWQEFNKGFTDNDKGFKKILEDFRDMQKTGLMVAHNLAYGMKDAFSQTFSDVIKGTKSVSEAFADMGNRIIDVFANMAAEIAAQQAIGFLFGNMENWFPKAEGTGFFGKLFGKANGGILPGHFNPIPAFADGTVATRPTLGWIGEGRYNEAVVPLPDGKSIPVEMQGNSGGNIIVNLTQVISAWDASDVMRNIKTISNAMVNEITANRQLRSAIKNV